MRENGNHRICETILARALSVPVTATIFPKSGGISGLRVNLRKMKFKDYYQILGVAESASQDEIKRAYRKKARQYHPDVSSDPDAEEKIKSVNEAYEVLGDENRRAEFDRVKKHGFRGGDDFKRPPGGQGNWQSAGGGFGSAGGFGAGGSTDFSDFFESLFGQQVRPDDGFTRGRRPGQSGSHQSRGRHSKGDDIKLSVRVSLENAWRGGKTRIKVPAAPGFAEKTLTVNIPAGVTDQRQLRLRGQGRPGAIDGDLILSLIHI